VHAGRFVVTVGAGTEHTVQLSVESAQLSAGGEVRAPVCVRVVTAVISCCLLCFVVSERGASLDWHCSPTIGSVV
jgi:hypothetical protein